MRLRSGEEKTIAEILLHPEVAPGMTDDRGGLPSLEQMASWLSDPDVYVLSPAPGVLLIFEELCSVCYMAHQAAVPAARGASAVHAGRAAIAWMWENVPRCRKIIGLTPAYNLGALITLTAAGFSREGLIRRGFLKYGELHDIVLTGISRPETQGG